jgi:hypothetical protein
MGFGDWFAIILSSLAFIVKATKKPDIPGAEVPVEAAPRDPPSKVGMGGPISQGLSFGCAMLMVTRGGRCSICLDASAMARFSASPGAGRTTASTFEVEASSPARCEVFTGRCFALGFFMVSQSAKFVCDANVRDWRGSPV